MQTKLTLRLDKALITQAKEEAKKRGRSLSQMVGEYFKTLAHAEKQEVDSSCTAQLDGLLSGMNAEQGDYKKYLEEKYQ